MMNKTSFINGGRAGLSFGITLIEKNYAAFLNLVLKIADFNLNKERSDKNNMKLAIKNRDIIRKES